MTQRIEFASDPSTFGATSGAMSEPTGDGKVAGVIVLQEFWGINDHIKSVVERWAAAGFLALAPDLYRGELATDAAEASKLMNGLDRGRALADIAGAMTSLRTHPRCSGKIGITGYCMGGAYTLAAAARLKGVAAAVPFYGVPPGQDWSNVTAPIQAHFAAHDGWAKPEAAKEIQQAIQAGGGVMELHVYDAQHAFCNDTRPDVYVAEHAQAAWARAVAFMRQHLG